MTGAPEFEAAFREVFEDVLGWEVELGEDDSIGTVAGWDSLAHLRIVQALESRFGVRMPDEALLEPQSVAELRQLVLDRVATR
jgi:acyl carrier protein